MSERRTVLFRIQKSPAGAHREFAVEGWRLGPEEVRMLPDQLRKRCRTDMWRMTAVVAWTPMIAARNETLWRDQYVRNLKQANEQFDTLPCRQGGVASSPDATGTFQGMGCHKRATHVVVGQVIRL
jgi:hypothetical protein